MPAVAEKPVPRETPTRPTFEWDGWDLVREVDPAGVETVYYAPQGEVTSFKRGSSVYQVHADALGSIRVVTASNGTSVASTAFDAWGVQISSSGSVTSNLARQFVGAYGVFYDINVGLHCMRARWYDSRVQRFVSRDPLKSSPPYEYALNDPATNIDPSGLISITPELRARLNLLLKKLHKQGRALRFRDADDFMRQSVDRANQILNKLLRDNTGPKATQHQATVAEITRQIKARINDSRIAVDYDCTANSSGYAWSYKYEKDVPSGGARVYITELGIADLTPGRRRYEDLPIEELMAGFLVHEMGHVYRGDLYAQTGDPRYQTDDHYDTRQPHGLGPVFWYTQRVHDPEMVPIYWHPGWWK